MKSLRNFLKEALPVVFGVLLALFLNNWKEDLDSKRYVEEYYAHISEECTSNIEKLESAIDEHNKLFSVLNEHIESDTTFNEILEELGGFHLVLLQNTSWKYFQSSNFGKVDFEVTSALSAMERMEFYYDETANRLIDLLLEVGRSNKAQDKKDLILHLYELIEKEQTLTVIFKEYKEWFEAHTKR